MSREHPHLSVVADADALAKAAADRLLKRINQASGRLAGRRCISFGLVRAFSSSSHRLR
jgi:hypothetical protein